MVRVEDFRTSADDADTINAALRYVEAQHLKGTVLEFEAGREYAIGHTCWLGEISDLRLDLNGATLKRISGAEIRAATTSNLSFTATAIPLANVPVNWRIGDDLFIYTGDADSAASVADVKITAIGPTGVTISVGFGNTLTPQPLGYYPAGAMVSKSFTQIKGLYSTVGVNQRISICDGTLDGNGATYSNYSWRWCQEVLLHSRHGRIEAVDFRNTPGECIVGHGMRIEGCGFYDLGGSALHTSMHDSNLANSSPTVFTWNIVKGSNLKTNAKIGHSEGAITFSWNGGRLFVTSNEFQNGTECILGLAGPANVPNGFRNLVFSDNTASSFLRLFYGLNQDAMHITVRGNHLHDCGWNNYLAPIMAANPTIKLEANTMSGNTSGL